MDRHLARAARVYSDRRTRLVTALHRQAPELTVTGVEAGLHLCVLLPGVDDELVVNNLDRLGWRTRSLSSQCSEQSVSGLILNYARLGAWECDLDSGVMSCSDEVGQVLYMRGLIASMLAVEGVKRAQDRYGKGKVMTAEQVRWGLENLALDQKKLDALGFAGVMRPVSTSCADHLGSSWARLHTWDGAKWNFSSDWYQADEQIIKPMVKAAADKYAGDKKLTRRAPEDCQS